MDRKYFFRAMELAQRGQCIRRNYGCVIVKDGEAISEGFTQMPPKAVRCTRESCLREKLHIPSGKCYDICRSVHAEQVALIKADPEKVKGADLYLVGVDSDGLLLFNPFVCDICKKMLIYAGIKNVHIKYNTEEQYLVKTEVVADYVV